MKKFQHHPDGYAIVENEGLVYFDTLQNLEIDSGLQCPPCPENAVSVLYIVGRHNAAFDAEGNQFGGDEHCEQHYDALINNVAALLEAQAQRVAAAEAEAAAAAEAVAQEPV